MASSLDSTEKCRFSKGFSKLIVTFYGHSSKTNLHSADWCIALRRKLTSNGIQISGDYTDWQRKQLERLKIKARRHNKKYPNDRKAAFVKSGVPVLVGKRNHPQVKAEPSTTVAGYSGEPR